MEAINVLETTLNPRFIILINKKSSIIIRIRPKVEILQAKKSDADYKVATLIPLRRIRSSSLFLSFYFNKVISFYELT
jgi:hypothetical protein